jgi:hypothetical protein
VHESWAQMKMENDDDVKQNEFRIENDPSAILNQYLGGEKLEELILWY